MTDLRAQLEESIAKQIASEARKTTLEETRSTPRVEVGRVRGASARARAHPQPSISPHPPRRAPVRVLGALPTPLYTHLLQERIEKQIAPMQRDVDHHRSITEEAIRAKEQAEERALVLESQLAQAEMVRRLAVADLARARAAPHPTPTPTLAPD